MAFKTDIEIAREAKKLPIQQVGAKLGIGAEDLVPYGHDKAKVSAEFIASKQGNKDGKLILVTAINPTPAGEGKTTTTVGLGDGLNAIGKKAAICIREASLGPSFGLKGGAAGGGDAQVVPMEDMNLHFTGDFHAITSAHNLLSAMIDNHIYWGNSLGIDNRRVAWRRVMDMNDRALREIVSGIGGKENGVPRQTGFEIAVASEVMAILALAGDLKDLRTRLGRIIVGYTYDGQPVTAEQLRCAGSMAVLMRHAIKPTLVQTSEGSGVLLHAGPFGNIAHGNSSIVADRLALKLAEYVVTESGFGADLGMEKFFNIKCRVSGLIPHAVGIVATVRAIKMHSGRYKIVAGKPLPEAMAREDLDALRAGSGNLAKHIENVAQYGIPAVVAINRFPTDSENELAELTELALKAGATKVVVNEAWAKGGEGAEAFAQAIVEACDKPSRFRFLYDPSAPIKDKIHAICTKMYGAKGVRYSASAEASIARLAGRGFGALPVCMAKTHLSLSHDPKLLGRPEGFTVPVEDVKVSAGAGFLYALCGTMKTMPGLGSDPAGAHIDLDADGHVVGLF
ncbi:MAG: formate--tetrahydrofolate ligase [Planctomycetota bacterium]|nr:formate--tetrahydrofolate ligase [Planctomycetota bacterium]